MHYCGRVMNHAATLPFPYPSSDTSHSFLQAVGRPAESTSEAQMTANGWSILGSASAGDDPGAVRTFIDDTILLAWPQTVRLTFHEAEGTLVIWSHPNPPTSFQSLFPFPTQTNLAEAVRVIIAVGTARSLSASAAVAQMPDPDKRAALRCAIDAEQARFEAVAAVIATFNPARR